MKLNHNKCSDLYTYMLENLSEVDFRHASNMMHKIDLKRGENKECEMSSIKRLNSHYTNE